MQLLQRDPEAAAGRETWSGRDRDLIKPSAHVIWKDTVGKVTVSEGAELDVQGTLEIEEPGDLTKRR